MKEDYLWDKTGEDSEIERLENALRAFRYQETAPPALPATILPFKKEPSRRVYRFAMAAAACLLFGLFAAVGWVQLFNNEIETGNDLAEIKSPRSQTSINAESIVKYENVLPDKTLDNNPIKRIDNSKQISERKFVKVQNTASANAPQKQTKAQKVKNIKPEIRLTEEEQYAYDQLMLALSITSSKLKMVRDKVEGLEDQAAAAENGK